MSKVFVIVVTYNGLKWIDKCLGSLRNSRIELQPVVIDNHSTDGTVEYIKTNYPGVHLIENSENSGFGKANNIGLEYAIKNNCDYVFLLNQDAWIEPDTISNLVEIHKRNPIYGILSPLHLSGNKEELDYNFSIYISADRCPRFVSDLILKRAELQEVYTINFVNAALWLICRECLEVVGGFDPIFPHYGEDDDYIYRVHYHQLKVGICPAVRACHDRPQNVNVFAELPIEKEISRAYVRKLTALKDLYSPLSYKLLSIIKVISVDLLTNLLKLNFSDIRFDLTILLKILKNLRIINKNRKMSLKKGYSFLTILK